MPPAQACIFVNSSDALFVPHGSVDDPGADVRIACVCIRRRDGDKLLAALERTALSHSDPMVQTKSMVVAMGLGQQLVEPLT